MISKDGESGIILIILSNPFHWDLQSSGQNLKTILIPYYM